MAASDFELPCGLCDEGHPLVKGPVGSSIPTQAQRDVDLVVALQGERRNRELRGHQVREHRVEQELLDSYVCGSGGLANLREPPSQCVAGPRQRPPPRLPPFTRKLYIEIAR